MPIKPSESGNEGYIPLNEGRAKQSGDQCVRMISTPRRSRAFEEYHKAGRDVGFRLRRSYGATGWTESGFALPIAGPVCNITPPLFPSNTPGWLGSP